MLAKRRVAFSNKSAPKRSRTVGLVLLGTLGTAWVGYFAWQNTRPENITLRQDQYASMDDCLADWGGDANTCTPAQANSSGSTSGGGYRAVGPRYYWFRNAAGGGYPVELSADGQTRQLTNSRVSSQGSTRASGAFQSSHSISRGGFGSLAGKSSGG